VETTQAIDTGAVLKAWRARILTGVLAIIAFAALPAWAMTIINLTREPGGTLLAVLFSAVFAVVAALAVARRLDARLRAWGLLLVGYAAGTANLLANGLLGAGPSYLLLLPVAALILIGVREGIVTSVLSALLAASVFLLPSREEELAAAIESFATVAMFLAGSMSLLVVFYRFMLKIIDEQRATANELEEARALLEEQNRTLEERIVERTFELAIKTHEAQREKLYSEALIQHSPVAIVTTDPAIEVVTWNPAAEALFGYTAEEASGRKLDDLVANSPDLHARAVAFGREVTAGAPCHAITRRTRRDGTLVDVEISAVPILVAGEVMGVLALYHDLTEIKRAEEALQESFRRMADIINFMPDAVLVISHQGQVIAWNRAIEELTGTKAEEMLGKGDYEYALPFYGRRRPILIDLVTLPQKELEQNYAHIRREGQTLVGETFVPQLRGKEAYLLGTASTLHNSRGEVVGAIEVIRDFTERKHIEEDLNRAKEAAEAATQAKSAFLATMSHEIRTPMNAVIGMTGLLLDTPLTPEQQEFAETIRTSGDALLTIINDILDFSKIEAERMELEGQPFDLRECVESALDLVAGRAAEKGLDLGCVVDRDVPQAVEGDVGRLRQILVNLLGNAVKFTEQGEVVVTVARDTETQGHGDAETRRRGDTDPAVSTGEETISASPRPPVPVSLHFVVRDTGIGIPPDRMDRLFQSFSQVDASTTRRFGGTGLGLAISRRLAELMGGTMWVESEGVPGKGSTFHFTLRAPVAEALARRPHLESAQPHLEGKLALIVDDNATNRQILRLQTQAWGILPQECGSPPEALSWIRRGDPFDVALLDLQMPEMDGLDLAAEIRRLRRPGELPIVILSSLGPREAREVEVELAAYLLKPVKASQLYNALISIFGSEEGARLVTEGRATVFDAEMGKRHPLSILLAEDHAINQKLALLVLQRLGYRADVAGNGLEALEAVRRQRYDVVLMDVQMPEMDGLEATRAIRREFREEVRPRIVAMTANAMKEDREECFAAGMDDFIVKPIQFEELVTALNRCQARVAVAGEGRAVETVETSPGPAATVAARMPEDAPAPAAGGVEGGRQAEEGPPVLDPAALERLRASLGAQGEAILPSLIEDFYQDAPKLMAEARRRWEVGQAAELRRAAHTLKSSSATFGAMALSELARELEHKARDGALENAEELLARMDGAFMQARAALEGLSKE
jgi:PAS domain S-box-containing protein